MAELTFSIIIPVYNDKKIVDCLESITQLNYDLRRIEIIVVDNNSSLKTPNTIPELIKPFQTKLRLRTIREPKSGSYMSRNTGIRIAEGTSIALTDSDCVVDPHWLTQAENILKDAGVMGVMGFSAGDNGNVIARYEQKMYEEIIHAFTEQPTLLRRIDTRNFVMRRELFEQLNGFNDNLKYGGDMEFGARAHASGNVIRYNHLQQVTHTNPTNFSVLFKKRIKQNAGNMSIMRYHDRIFIEQYFPHLLRYSPGRMSSVKRFGWLIMQMLLFPIWPVLYILPPAIGFWLYKVYTVIAIRLGQLNYVIQNS